MKTFPGWRQVGRLIPLSKDFFATVDDADYDRVLAAGCWYASVQRNTVYAHRSLPRVAGKTRKLTMHGFLTGYDLTDHINGNGLDNRRVNLRPVTTRQNAQNERSRGGASQFKGVTRATRKEGGRWQARIRTADGRRLHLGTYLTEVEAAVAYDNAARSLHGQFAALNFPRSGERGAVDLEVAA